MLQRIFRFLLLLSGLGQPLAHGATLVLANGDRITGTVLKHENGKVTFHSDVLGNVVAPESAVSIIDTPAAPVSGSAAAAKPAAAAAPKAKAKPAPAPWAAKVEFGYDNQVTNTRTVSTTLRVQADRTIGQDDLLAKARYLYGKTDGLPTTDLEDGEFRVRHNLDTRVFAQTDTTAGANDIQLIRFEGQENLGLGYKLVTTTRQAVNVGGGISGQYLNAEGIEQGWNYLGNVFQDYNYKISGHYTLKEDLSAQYSPDRRARFGLIGDPSLTTQTGSEEDYAYKFHSTLEGKISHHLSLNLHFEYEYNNAVLDPTERVDQRVTTTLGYAF